MKEIEAIDEQIRETELKLMHLQEQRREIINRLDLNKVNDEQTN